MVLPDLLAPGLSVVFVGSAAGAVSAARGAYYAGPGNRFWPVLHRIGLTPRQLRPEAYAELLPLGIGLTDLNKTQSGADSALSRAHDGREALLARLAAAAPRHVAFNGKRAASIALARPSPALSYGRQPRPLAGATCWVLPSTSGAASGFWSETPWQALAQALRNG